MAAHLRGRSMCRPFLLLFIIIASMSSSVTAQICSFWDAGCVDPLAQTAVGFGFPPLFLEDINLFYAFDADPRGKGQDPMTKASFWISYAAYINNSVIDVNRTSEIGMRVGNLTGIPSGANNGCDGVWGTECSHNLRRLFQKAILDLTTSGHLYSNPLAIVIGQFLINPPYIPNCPPQFFDVQFFPVDQFAQETENDQTAVIKTTGSSYSPWKTWFIDNMTASEQAQQVAVAIISRAPSYSDLDLLDKDGIQIDFICMQAPAIGSSVSVD